MKARKIINCWELLGYKANTDNMICGLFDQDKLYCDKRDNIID